MGEYHEVPQFQPFTNDIIRVNMKQAQDVIYYVGEALHNFYYQ